MTNRISDIPADAPLFQKVPEETLLQLILKLSQASYHFADDTSKEWPIGYGLVNEFAAEANTLNLRFAAVSALVRHAPQLVTLEQVIDAMLRQARLSAGMAASTVKTSIP